jgi:hypothetical protein
MKYRQDAMLSLDEPSVTGPQRPIISDAKSCQNWLAALPLTQATAAHTEIQLQLDLLNHTSALSGIERLRIQEQLRESVAYVQSEMAKKYAGKPVPLDAAELAVWKKVISLWQGFTQAYQICLQNYQDNDQTLASFAPAIRSASCVSPASRCWNTCASIKIFPKRCGNSCTRLMPPPRNSAWKKSRLKIRSIA